MSFKRKSRYIAHSSTAASATRGQPPNDDVTKIVLLGNPGLGKSTLLNLAAGAEVFNAGFSRGIGLTTVCAYWRGDSSYFIDTPGIGDVAGIEVMANEALKALQTGNRTKIVFVWGLESGRLRPMDMAVTKAFTRILQRSSNVQFGVIINKVDFEEAGINSSSSLSDVQALVNEYTLTIAKQNILPAKVIMFERLSLVNREPGLYYEPGARKNLNNFLALIPYTMIPTICEGQIVKQFHDDLDGGTRVRAAIAQMERSQIELELDARDPKFRNAAKVFSNGILTALASGLVGAGVTAGHMMGTLFCSIM